MNKFWKQVGNLISNYPEISCDILDFEEEDTVWISHIMRLNPSTTRKGIGKEFLRKLCFLFDSYGYDCRLNIEEWSAVDKLTELYSSLGFEVIHTEPFDYVEMVRYKKSGYTITR